MKVNVKLNSRQTEVLPVDLGMDRLVGVDDAAKLIAVDPKTIWRRLTEKKLTRFKVGSRTVVKVREVLALAVPQE